MQASLTFFILPVVLNAIDGLNLPLNGHIILVLAGLEGVVALSVVAGALLCMRTKLTASRKVLGIGVCLLAGLIILSLLGFVGYSTLASHGGIMLAAPLGPSAIVMA